MLVERLMAMRPQPIARPGYDGQWYRLPDDPGFGLRHGDRNGDTVDFDNPALGKGFKVHVK
jgi:hypothetical protein